MLCENVLEPFFPFCTEAFFCIGRATKQRLVNTHKVFDRIPQDLGFPYFTTEKRESLKKEKRNKQGAGGRTTSRNMSRDIERSLCRPLLRLMPPFFRTIILRRRQQKRRGIKNAQKLNLRNEILVALFFILVLFRILQKID